MIGTQINDRYRIDSELGQGGMGTVYKGFDTTLKRDIAVKIMTETRLGTEGRNRLLQEAQAIAQLSHPNIVTVYDAGEYENSPFIVMEYVEGVNLYDQPPTDIGAIVVITRQICAALAHAHEQGIIHRDLKPENIILTTDGTVKLMDFGLARSISSRLTSEGTILGTVFYLAPEQAQGKPIDPRSDLYSLGVMLYELMAGELPFTASDPLAVVSQHIHAPVVPPRAKNEHIPPALEALILELMGKDPEERPASAKEVLERLSMPEMLDVTALPLEELSVLDRIVRGRLVGREQELKQARQMWQQAMAGQGQLLLVSGEPGVGKTRLMREVVTQAEVSGGQVYIGESQAEGNAPYAAFAQIIRRALRTHQNNTLELPNLVLAELILIAPELQIMYPEISPNPALEPESEQRRLFECIITFFSTLCAQSPLLLVLEDIHWADSGTLSLLQFLARRCREHPVMLLGTYREVELDEALPFHQTLLDLNRKNLGTRLKLERLDQNKTRDMLAVIFAEEIRPDFLAGIYQETEGNPFFIEEVCKALIESGQVYFDGEIWRRPPDMADIEIPQSIKVAVQSRVSKLSEATQETLLNAAVIGREFGFELLQKVTGKEEDDLIEGLEAALKAQLIEEIKEGVGERFSFSHALIPTTLRESLSGMRRTRLHRKVAQVMEEVMPNAYQRLAYHWGESGDLDKALDYTIKAAEWAKETYANEDAIRLYSEALKLITEDDYRRFDLLKARAEVFNMIMERDSQLADIEAMLTLAEKLGNKAQQVDALLAQANLFMETDVPAAREPSERAQEISHQIGDGERESEALFILGKQYRYSNDHGNARMHLEDAIDLARKADNKLKIAEYLCQLSRVLDETGDEKAALETIQKAAALNEEINEPRINHIVASAQAVSYYLSKNYDEAISSLESLLKKLRVTGDVFGIIDTLNAYGLVLIGLNRYGDAEASFLEMFKLHELFSSSRTWYAAYNLGCVYYLTGDYEKYLYLIEDLIDKAQETKGEFWIYRLNTCFAWPCFWLGKFQHLKEIYELIIWPYDQKTASKGVKTNDLTDLGVCAGFTGDIELAYQYLEEAKKYFDDSLEPEARGTFFFNSARVNLMDSKPEALKAGLELAEKGMEEYQKGNITLFWSDYQILAGLHLALIDEDQCHAREALNIIEKGVMRFDKNPVNLGWIHEHFFYLVSRIYRANNLIPKADEYLRKAYDRVLLVAGKIKNDELRRSYLDNVKENREILQEAKVRGITKN